MIAQDAAGYPQTGTMLIDGPPARSKWSRRAGRSLPRGIAVVAHPQPLLGGNATHKIPHLLARALRRCGLARARPNFRGVGGSQGTHDGGVGETDDMLAVVARLRDGLSGSAARADRLLVRRLRAVARGARRWPIAASLRVASCSPGCRSARSKVRRQYTPDGSLPDALSCMARTTSVSRLPPCSIGRDRSRSRSSSYRAPTTSSPGVCRSCAP